MCWQQATSHGKSVVCQHKGSSVLSNHHAMLLHSTGCLSYIVFLTCDSSFALLIIALLNCQVMPCRHVMSFMIQQTKPVFVCCRLYRSGTPRQYTMWQCSRPSGCTGQLLLAQRCQSCSSSCSTAAYQLGSQGGSSVELSV
jgi:hypothetical protein